MIRKIRTIIENAFIMGTLIFGILAVPNMHNLYLRHLGSKYTTRLRGIRGGGTGFQVVMPNGQKYIVTNRHVCEVNLGIPYIYVEKDNQTHEIVKFSETSDLCLITPIKKLGGLRLAGPVYAGQTVNVLGYPELAPLHLSKGEVITEITENDSPSYCKESIYIGAQVLPGNSGSPVVDAFGRVIGIVWGQHVSNQWALIVPVRHLKREVKQYEGKTLKFRNMSKVRKHNR